MRTPRRAGILGIVLGIAAYVTGLQKKVLSPILSWFGDQATGVQLAILGVVALVVVGLLALRYRRNRTELRRAMAVVGDSWQPAP